MKDKYIKFLGIQLDVNLDCNEKEEYLIEDDYFYKQMYKIKELIRKKSPDIIALPEMCYVSNLDDYFLRVSKNKLIIAGSVYENGINYTVVFNNKSKYFIKKYNASSEEPMIRYQDNVSTDDFIKYHLDEHVFKVRGKKIVVLNCMEYYQHAYTIARSYSDLFAIVCICSNSNQKLFLEETRALHNHVENIYSFVINCVSNYQGESYANGGSYVYGPVQKHEQEWLRKSGVKVDDHVCSILKADDKASYIYGEFTNDFSRYGRSDYYLNNPRNVEVKILIGGEGDEK